MGRRVALMSDILIVSEVLLVNSSWGGEWGLKYRTIQHLLYLESVRQADPIRVLRQWPWITERKINVHWVVFYPELLPWLFQGFYQSCLQNASWCKKLKWRICQWITERKINVHWVVFYPPSYFHDLSKVSTSHVSMMQKGPTNWSGSYSGMAKEFNVAIPVVKMHHDLNDPIF